MKILFIACYSPLINNSASIETLQYLNNLANIEGNEVHLLTVNFPKDSIYYDEYILGMLDKKVKMHIISGGKIFEKIMPRKIKNIKDSNDKKELGFKNKLKKLKKIIAVPDMYLIWALKASMYGKKIMQKERFDVIFSMHEPPSSHICAYRIKRSFMNTKWITYWSDPWLKDSTRESNGIFRRNFEGILERKVINLADRFVFVTEANREDYIKSYNIPREKTYLITRGYDKEIYEELRKDKSPLLIEEKKVNIVYAGEIFSKLRNIRPFINTMKKIEKENKDLYESLNILFFGNIDDDSVKNELMGLSNATVSSRIAYREALSYMVKGDILLLFGNKNSKQIPAKIYDYFGCYAYILIILGDEEDPIITVVQGKEKCMVVLNNEELIERALLGLVEKISLGESSKPQEEYEWKHISKKLNDILKEQ